MLLTFSLLAVAFVLAVALLSSAYFQSTCRAVFSPVGLGCKTMPTNTTCFQRRGLAAVDLFFQAHVQRQDSLPEPVTAYAVAVHLPAWLVAEDAHALEVVVIGTFGLDEVGDCVR